MTSLEYKVLQIQIRQLPTVKVPTDLGAAVDAAAAEGWQLQECVPVISKGILGGSYTDSVLLFLRRERRG